MNLSVLQIPDGGIDIHDYIDNNKITKEDFYKINKKLIKVRTVSRRQRRRKKFQGFDGQN